MKAMFGHDEGWAGFDNIVNHLIADGYCVTTKYALDMNFGKATRFIKALPIADAPGCIKLCFNRGAAKNSPEYRRMEDK